MSAPNLFLIYVTDTQRSTRFHSELFAIEPVFIAPTMWRSKPETECRGQLTNLGASSFRVCSGNVMVGLS